MVVVVEYRCDAERDCDHDNGRSLRSRVSALDPPA
jgi:hypothetical protein